MIRRKAVSVKVKAPSRGLVTRWPSETADLFNATPPDMATLYSGMSMKRAWSVAQNVRFEDGVIAAAPGYLRVVINTSLLTGALSHFRMEEAAGTRFDSFGFNNLTEVPGSSTFFTGSGPYSYPLLTAQVAGKLGFAVSVPRTIGAPGSIVQPYLHTTAAPLATLAPPITMACWFKPQATSGTSLILGWPGMTLKQSGTGLQLNLFESGINFTGTSTFSAGTLTAGVWYFLVLVVQGTVATLSINNGAVSTFNPHTAGTFQSTGPQEFFVGDTAPSVGFSLDSLTIWSRAVLAADTATVYNSGTGLEFPFLIGTAGTLLYEANLIVSNVAQKPLIFGAGGQLFSLARTFVNTSGGNPIPAQYQVSLSQIYPASGMGTSTTAGYNWRAADFFDKVIFAQKENTAQYWVGGTAQAFDLPGLALNSTNPFTATPDGNAQWEGVESFFGHILLWRGDTLIWSDLNDFANYIPIGATAVAATLHASTFTQPAVGSTVALTFSDGLVPLVANEIVRVIDGAKYNYYQVQASPAPTASTCTVKLLGTTGITAPAATITSPVVTSLNANEAGTSRVVGANVNGPIFQVVALSDYAYIFKEWSIQSLQYVGQANGTFFMRTEVTREGLIGRNSFVKLVNGGIVFLGHRELYTYGGGSVPQAVCRQFTRQLLSELDRTRLDQVILIHRDSRNEIWVVYPVQGGQKVLVWNYVEDTATLDAYDPILGGLTAGTRVSWIDDPAWTTGSALQTWASFPDTTSWASFTGTGTDELALIATGNFELLVHGTVFNREGQAYTALGETMDFDFGDNTVFKYIDAIHVGLQTTIAATDTKNLYVQVGTRSTLDADITWSTAKAIQVQGNANSTAKINPGSGAGRYIRLRFYSQDANVNWRISSYEIYARSGGTY